MKQFAAGHAAAEAVGTAPLWRVMTRSQRVSGESAVLEMREYECGFDDVANLAGAGGEVPQGAPAAGEQGEASFAEAAQ